MSRAKVIGCGGHMRVGHIASACKARLHQRVHAAVPPNPVLRMASVQAMRRWHFRKANLVLPENATGGQDMGRHKNIIFGAALFSAGAAAIPSIASAQSFQSYRCADGTQFIVGFFEYDKRAHLQIDGKAVTLARRPALSGARYAGGGVTLKIDRAGATVKHAKRPTTACELI